MVDCQASEASEDSQSVMSVADFFEEYRLGDKRTDDTIKKLKDWPSYTEFRKSFQISTKISSKLCQFPTILEGTAC